jgi:hypothetical protein
MSLYSSFETLPAEAFNNVLGELVGTSNESTRSYAHPSRMVFRRTLELHPAILRANRGIFKLAKSWLDLESKWIVFDVDFLNLLKSWVRAVVPFSIADSEDGAVLPEGILHVRMRMYTSVPTNGRGSVVVAEKHLVDFIQCLKIIMYTHSERVQPNQPLARAPQGQLGVLAARGFHGLRT